MEPVRLGVVGVGDMGGYHTLGFTTLEEAHVVAIADINESRMDELLAEIPEYEIARYTDYRELLQRDDIEAVVVALPQYLHREVTLAALDAGLDIFLEKPMAPMVSEADEIIAAHRDSDRVMQIGLVYRYAGLFRKMAEMCAGGEYGRTTMMWCNEMRENFPPRDWFYDRERSGGAIMDKCVHYFDLFNWMIGAPAQRVFAIGGQHVIQEGKPHLVECTYSFWEPGRRSYPPATSSIMLLSSSSMRMARGRIWGCACTSRLPTTARRWARSPIWAINWWRRTTRR